MSELFKETVAAFQWTKAQRMLMKDPLKIAIDLNSSKYRLNGTAITHICSYGSAIDGSSALLQFLLACGADPDGTDSCGYSGVHLCSLDNKPDKLQILIDKGANVNLQTNEFKCTALHFAAEESHDLCIEILLAADCDKNVQDKDGHRPYDYAKAWNRQMCMQLLK